MNPQINNTETEFDPFEFTEEEKKRFSGLRPAVRWALDRHFYVFPLQPRSKLPLSGSQGFKDSKAPTDPQVLTPWLEDPYRNIGIDLGSSDLCVLDFDKPEAIPAWLNETKTLKIRTGKGVHFYFRGARKTTKLQINGNEVGDLKSTGGYVLSSGSVHPSGAIYTVIDDSPIIPLPDISSLVRNDSGRVNASEDGPLIPRGSHDTELTRIAGVLRNAGFTEAKIAEHLIEVCENRCESYGSDYREMCNKIAQSISKYPVGSVSPGVLLDGKIVGQSAQTPAPANWRDNFKAVGELEQGDVRMLIDSFLPEGTIFIGGLPGEGKTLFALSITKALTTGKSFLGKFRVSEIVPVIYLIPESGGRAFRKRCEKFQIPDNPDLFLCRTVSEGSTLPLDDGSLLEAIRRLKPVVILDTIIRFSEAQDENQAMQNKQLVDDVIRLRQAGAVAVIGLHHATKMMREKGMTLETALRGTGDIAASADAVYGLLRDSMLYNNGLGPNEIDVACLKPRDFEPPMPFRIAASQKSDGLIKFESVIDRFSDFLVVSKTETEQASGDLLERLVTEDPAISLKELSEATKESTWQIRKKLKARNLVKRAGGARGSSQWVSNIPVKPDVSFGPSDTGPVIN